jgi:hypothetical protein
MKEILKDSVDELATLVEEGTRANKGNIERFIEPAEGTLRRTLSKWHHIIFGRRGSGKSSLIYKAANDLSKSDNPVGLVDLEPFKGHQYPDIIISVLLATFSKYSHWLSKRIESEKDRRLWYTFWIFKKLSKKKREFFDLKSKFDQEVKLLIEQLHLTDNASLKKILIDRVSSELSSSISSKVGTESINAEAAISEALSNSKNTELQEEFKRSKKEYLLRKVLDFKHLFSELHRIGGNDAYIFLDDLYHISRIDQPDLIDYFHKIAKGNNLWIKIATIRNRTTWYKHSPQPLGLKIGDDIDEINLDLTLEKFSTTKDFLTSILKRYIQDVSAPGFDKLITEGGMDRLVLSSGGVTRDFLGLFRRAIDETRERLRRSGGKHHRGDRIGAEDANLASGNYGEVKKEEFQRDTPEDREKLENAFDNIKEFCLSVTKKNVFLIDQEEASDEYELIKELIDLRLLHQIKSRVTVSAKPGKIYKAFLLDVSQYTGERARRDVEMTEFWKDSEKEKLRSGRLIYDPEANFDDIKPAKEKNLWQEKGSKKNDSSDSAQTKLDF